MDRPFRDRRHARYASMSNRLMVGLGLFIGVAFFCTHTAWGYVRTRTAGTNLPMAWHRGCLRMELMAGSPLPSFVTTALFQQAAADAATAWNNVVDKQRRKCGGISMSVITTPLSSFEVDADNVMSVQFRRDLWGRKTSNPARMEIYPSNALAITSVFARASTGEIVDADVEINAIETFRWGDLVANPHHINMGAADLQNTLTHEFGHVLGLDHTCTTPTQPDLRDHAGRTPPPCDKPTPEVAATTMFATVVRSDIERRTLAQDDMDGICSAYPATKPLPCEMTPGEEGCAVAPNSAKCAMDKPDEGGCTISAKRNRAGGPHWTAGLGVLGVLFWLGRRRGRRPV